MTGTTTLTSAHIKAQSHIAILEHLACLFEQFERDEFTRTHQKLYEILAKVYEQYLALKTDRSLLSTVAKELVNELKRKGQRVQANSTVLSLFVRTVFPNSGRQRIHNYVRAIQAAHADNVPPCDFAAFVTDQGGIEECGFRTKNHEQKDHALLVNGMQLVEDMLTSPNKTALASFKADLDLLSELKGSNIAVLLGEVDAAGNVTVVSVVPGYKKSVVAWAKGCMAHYLSGLADQASHEDKKFNAANAIDEAVSMSRKIDLGTATFGELKEA